MFGSMLDGVANVAGEVMYLDGLLWWWKCPVGYGRGVKALNSRDVLSADGCDGVSRVEAGDGCSVIV